MPADSSQASPNVLNEKQLTQKTKMKDRREREKKQYWTQKKIYSQKPSDSNQGKNMHKRLSMCVSKKKSSMWFLENAFVIGEKTAQCHHQYDLVSECVCARASFMSLLFSFASSFCTFCRLFVTFFASWFPFVTHTAKLLRNRNESSQMIINGRIIKPHSYQRFLHFCSASNHKIVSCHVYSNEICRAKTTIEHWTFSYSSYFTQQIQERNTKLWKKSAERSSSV